MKTFSFTQKLKPGIVALVIAAFSLLSAGKANAACKAGFTDSVSGKTIYFYSTSTAVSSHFAVLWSFGDKTNGSGLKTSHTYGDYNKSYLVCVVVIDSANSCMDSSCTTVTTGPAPCTATAGFTLLNGKGGSVKFTNTSKTSSGTYSSVWDFNDKTSSRDANPNHTFATNGFYHICLTVTDSLNKTCTSTYCLYDSIFTLPCTANIVGGASKLTGGFSDSGSTALAHSHSASWNFGDNTSLGSGDYVSHTFAKNGTYNVCVTVYDSSNACSATKCKSITINNCSLTASFADSTNGTTATFYGTTNASAHSKIKWFFGDGIVDSTSGLTVSHTYASTGAEAVYLSVYDSATGCTGYASQTISIACNALSDWSYSTNGVGGTTLKMKADAKNSSSATYQWDFNDKTSAGTTSDPSHTYSTAGTYNICLTVKNGSCTSTTCHSIKVPTCTLSATYAYTVTGHTVNFTVTSNASAHSKYTWYYGNAIDSTSGAKATYTFDSTLDSEEVYVRVYDSATLCQVYVTQIITFCRAFSYYNYTVNGYDVSFSSSTANASGAKYQWDFNDKSSAGTTADPKHTYTANGTYNVCLTVTNNGCSTTTCRSIVINTCSLTASFTESIDNHKVTFSGSTNASSHSKITWIFGDGTSDSTSGLSVTHTYASSVVTENVYMRVYDSTTKCVTYGTGTITLSFCILGSVTTGGTAGYPAKVYLITYNSTDSSLTAIDSTTTNSNGIYEFCGLSKGTYYTKGALTSSNSNYKNFIPTYHNDATKWATAVKIALGGYNDSGVNIAMKKGTNPGGTGFIAGKISAGAGKTGDPQANILVVLYDVNSNPVSYTYSNSLGEYSFSGLAFGTYEVYGEVLGKPCDPAIVTLTDSTASVNNIDLLVNMNSVTAAGIKPMGTWIVEKVDIFPNPVSDKLTLSMSLRNASQANLKIYDLTGKVVSELNTTLGGGAQKMEVDASSLPAGIYFLRMEMVKDNTLMEAQFVKAR